MGLEKFAANISGIQQVLDASRTATTESQVITGVIDGLQADFTIAPLSGEPSCREDLYPFDHGVMAAVGEHVMYRPGMSCYPFCQGD